VPARFAADAIIEAADAGIGLVVCITEGIPARDMAQVYPYVRAKAVTLIGPNCPGLISPGKANMGIIPGEITGPGPVGLVSRSGTLTYQVMYEMFTRGVGQSTCIGIGGDPIVGSNFIDVISRFGEDPGTKAVVLIGEIGGDEEERAASFVKENLTKPVVAYVAGHTAPPGKRMGHAGAIISGSKGTAQAKAEAFESMGIRVGRNPTAVAELAIAALG
jgi:succinyl-CoA synthetase alpha subunit